MKLFKEVTRDKRAFYALNVNMHFSFDSLAKIAEKQLGAELDVGDIIVADNKNQDKRKVLQKTKFGYIIHYARLHKRPDGTKNTFTQLAPHNGQLKALTGPLF